MSHCDREGGHSRPEKETAPFSSLFSEKRQTAALPGEMGSMMRARDVTGSQEEIKHQMF